jgi:5-methylcytosine-specific restriction endonuclease McrA
MFITRATWTETIETETTRVRNRITRWSIFGIPLFTTRDEVFRKGASISQELRERVLYTDGYQCVYCGTSYLQELAIDHRVPQVDGGETIESNLLTACRFCNSRKNGRTPEDAGMPLRFGRYLGIHTQELDNWRAVCKDMAFDPAIQAAEAQRYEQRKR